MHRGFFSHAHAGKRLLWRLCPTPKWQCVLQALGDLLKTTHRGYFIPPRPEKNPVEGQRASADFVEGRRTALQHYLEQLAAHPVISQSEVRLVLQPPVRNRGDSRFQHV